MLSLFRQRRKLIQGLGDQIQLLTIYRPGRSQWGEPIDPPKPHCQALGYHFYKYERVSVTMKKQGRYAKEKTERYLVMATDEQMAQHEGEHYFLPVFKAGDYFDQDGNRYFVRGVQNDAKAYLTLVVEVIGT